MAQKTLTDVGNEQGESAGKREADRIKSKAHEMAQKQQEISVAAFFEKNRHLLGFDNKRKALLTTVKEAVDNSLDACEEAGILPEIHVEMIQMDEERFRIIVEDNGPGIVKNQIPKVFGKLLYGSKFFTLRQSRGQQGIGISAAVMYAQLTTGRPAKITSKIHPNEPAHYYELHINTQKNMPEIVKEESKEWAKEHGTRVELDLEAIYQKGSQSVDQYLKQTAIVNPHVTLVYTNPKAEQIIFARATDSLPQQPKEIKPHPYGVELGMFINMLKMTQYRTLQQFLCSDFSRVGPGTAKEICQHASVLPSTPPKDISREMAERLTKAIKVTKIIAPATDCVVPISEMLLEKGLKKEINAEFYTAVSRPPEVYRGNPFVIECALAYGGEQSAEESVTIYRFANRVPLLYQQSACATYKAIIDTNWRSYGLSQSASSLPIGPVTVAIHMASVWVPFTSESKEAIAHYPEIIKEIKLALQECGRRLYSYLSKKQRVGYELKKRGYIEKYIPHVAEALKGLLGLKDSDREKIEAALKEILEKTRGEVEDIDFKPEKNVEYDETFAKIGKEEKKESAEGSEDGEGEGI